MSPANTAIPFFTDRSRQVLYEKCPRARFWNTVYGGWGIQPAVPDLDMELGTAGHVGVAAMLDGKDLNEALSLAMQSLILALDAYFPPPIIQSYCELAEGLLRAFSNLWYPKLKAKFQIVGLTETEMSAWLNDEVGGVVHMSRPDAVLQDRSTGEYGVWSIKTTSFSDDDELELEYRTDTQGLAEMWSAEQYFKKSPEDLAKGPPKISWAQLFFIHTGQKENVDGGHIHQSPAYQGWYRDDGLGSVQLAHSYWWKDAGGKKKGLGSAWKRFNVAEMYDGGIAQWIEDLAAGKIQPEAGNPLEKLFFLPPAYYRKAEALEEWRLSTFYQENNIRNSSEGYHHNRVSDDVKDQILLSTFPQHRSSCIYMRRKCSFYQLCHGTAGEAEDPFSNGYKWRGINHPQEKAKGEH